MEQDRELKDKVKLEDAHDSVHHATKKRKVYDEISDADGPLTQEDVKYFKKQAIWRQMNYYKIKAKESERSVDVVERKVEELTRQLTGLKNWQLSIFKQLAKPVSDDLELVSSINDIIIGKITDEEIKEKVQKLNECIEEITKLEGENEVLRTSQIDLQVKVEELTGKLLKQKERLASETVQRVNNTRQDEPAESEQKEPENGTHPASTYGESSEEVKDLKRMIDDYAVKFQQLSRERDELAKEIKAPVEVIRIENASISNHSVLEEELTKKEAVIKQLNQQINNYNEMTSHQLSKEVQNLKEILQKNENDLVRIRNVRDDLLNKVSLLERQKPNDALLKLNEELSKQLDFQNIKSTNGDASSDEIIKELEESYKKIVQEIHIKVLSKVEQDNLIKKYQIEKTKADQKYFQIMKLKDTLTNENKLLKLSVNKSNEVIDKFGEIENKYKDKINKLQEINSDFQKQISELKLDSKKLVEDNNHKAIEINKIMKKVNEMAVALKTGKQEKVTLETKLNEKNFELIKLNKYKNQANSSAPMDNEELNGFRSMVKCSVCSKNWKDTVITVCGHVFCNQCTKERLNARLRRCPSCNKGFSGNDLLGIHL